MIEAQALSKAYGRSSSPFGLAMQAVDALAAAFGLSAGKPVFAVHELSFTLDAGGIVGFLGPNGAGKTTTLKMLTGFLRPTRGLVRLFGRSIFDDYRSVFSRVGALIDKPSFYEYLSAYDNLALKARLFGISETNAIDRVLAMVDLEAAADGPVSTFSTGMKQRLGLAAALLHEPELLILDEPTRGLDPRGQAEVRAVLEQVRDEGKSTILLSSHLLHEVELICDRVVIIDKGRHLHTGEVRSLLEGGGESVKVVVSDAGRAVELLSGRPEIERVEQVGHGDSAFLKVDTSSGGAALVAEILVKGGIALRELTPVRRSLEEFFLKVTSGASPAEARGEAQAADAGAAPGPDDASSESGDGTFSPDPGGAGEASRVAGAGAQGGKERT